MFIVLALIALGLGAFWLCWRLFVSSGRIKAVQRLFDAVVGAGLFAMAASIALKEFLNLPVSLWSVLSLILVFFIFIDAVQSALKFHAEDMGRDY